MHVCRFLLFTRRSRRGVKRKSRDGREVDSSSSSSSGSVGRRSFFSSFPSHMGLTEGTSWDDIFRSGFPFDFDLFQTEITYVINLCPLKEFSLSLSSLSWFMLYLYNQSMTGTFRCSNTCLHECSVWDYRRQGQFMHEPLGKRDAT